MTSRGASTHAAAYRYDRKNQLVDEFFTDASAVNHRIAYTYDGTGNRSEVTETVSSQDIVRQYTVNSLNQVTAVARTASANQLPNLDIWGVFSGNHTQAISIDGTEADYSGEVFSRTLTSLGKIRGHKDTGTQRYGDTKIRGHKDTGTQRYGDTKIRGHKDTGTQRYGDTSLNYWLR
ncbi:MAG: hypothetical protein RBU23_00325 [Candidatus Auribacterota bacterium]|nr:hypothetical protein [Candidatus Auribacterota bacterium]